MILKWREYHHRCCCRCCSIVGRLCRSWLQLKHWWGECLEYIDQLPPAKVSRPSLLCCFVTHCYIMWKYSGDWIWWDDKGVCSASVDRSIYAAEADSVTFTVCSYTQQTSGTRICGYYSVASMIAACEGADVSDTVLSKNIHEQELKDKVENG